MVAVHYQRCCPPPTAVPLTAHRDTDHAFWTALVLEAVEERPELLPHLAVVALRAANLARRCGKSEDDAALLYVAGLVHDVGKVPSLAITGFHPMDGANLAERNGASRLALLVAHHTGARYEARMHGLDMPYPWQSSDLHDLLMLADLTTGPDGKSTTLAARQADIESRYTSDSVEVRALHELWPTALKAARRFDIGSGAS